MAEPALELGALDAEDDGKVVQMPGTEGADTAPGADAPLALARTAEGGLTVRFAFDLPKVPSVLAVKTWTHQQMINGALIAAVALLLAVFVYDRFFAGGTPAPAAEEHAAPTNLRQNVETEFNPSVETPVIGAGSYIDTLASVIGNVSIGTGVFVAPFASIRGDEGQPIVIGDGSNVQDGVVLHALETQAGTKVIEKNLVTVDGKKYAVYVGSGVSLAHQSQVHGPAAVGDHTFVGMQALVFKSVVGKNVVIEPGAKLIGVTVAEGRYVPAGSVVVTQEAADALPKITDAYPFAKLNDGVLKVNEAFADKYLELSTGHAAEGGEGHGATAGGSGHGEATTTSKKTATAEKTTDTHAAATAPKKTATPKAAEATGGHEAAATTTADAHGDATHK